jgi:Protein of unknown function (DUF3307)
MNEVALLQFVALLALHWLADFVLQTHWQASNKSKRLDALARHVCVYTAALAAGAVIIFGFSTSLVWFVAANGALHFFTDYFTSRWSARHFALAVRDTSRAVNFTQTYGHGPTEIDLRLMIIDPGRHWHNFFVVVGFDQFTHQVTLAATMWLTGLAGIKEAGRHRKAAVVGVPR